MRREPEELEKLSAAAIDSARLSAYMATVVIDMDHTLAGSRRDIVQGAIEQSMRWLEYARAALPVPMERVLIKLEDAFPNTAPLEVAGR
jgi:hypothetical protein